MYMEVSITQLRKNLFEIVNQAMEGRHIWVTYKGRRFRIAPEDEPASRLARIAPMQVLEPGSKQTNTSALQDEMAKAWERDWAKL
jgi:prevent-host-death family protein